MTPLGRQLIAAAEIIQSAAMQQFRVATLGGRLTLAFAGAAVALTAGVAGVMFVHLVGIAVLGHSRSDASRSAEYGRCGPVAAAILAACRRRSRL